MLANMRFQVEPSFKWLQQFVTRDVQDVMALDALESSHPISVPVNHPDEINEIFDRISYGKGKKLWNDTLSTAVPSVWPHFLITKGATIIRMLVHFIGEKTFRQGLTNYLKSR